VGQPRRPAPRAGCRGAEQEELCRHPGAGICVDRRGHRRGAGQHPEEGRGEHGVGVHVLLRRDAGCARAAGCPITGCRRQGRAFAAGAFYDYDPKYFQNTILKGFRSTGYGTFNVIEQVAPKVKARGMDFFAWDMNNANAGVPRLIPNYAEVTEVDLNGRRTSSPCFNHPDYRAFLSGKVESLLAGYASAVDGVAWGCEREGPLNGMLSGGGAGSCFCQFCQAKGRERGISVERARRDTARWASCSMRRVRTLGRWMATSPHSGDCCCNIPRF